MEFYPAVIILSCDKYEDVWDPFFTLFFKFWPDCPFPVYLITNEKEYNDNRITTIKTGKDIDWSTNIKSGLSKINCSHALILMDDYLLKSPVNTEKITTLFNWHFKNNVHFLQIFPCRPANPSNINPIISFNDIQIFPIQKKEPYRNSLQAGIWKKETLINLILEDESPWEFEQNGSERTNSYGNDFYSLTSQSLLNLPLKYPYFTGIIKGYWEWETIYLCKKHDIKLDFSKRKKEPVITNFLRRTKLTQRIRVSYLRILRVIKKLLSLAQN